LESIKPRLIVLGIVALLCGLVIATAPNVSEYLVNGESVCGVVMVGCGFLLLLAFLSMGRLGEFLYGVMNGDS
jgi:uncharacterized membrane protein HdeD (DUF308 family)